ncbi:MAG TPA: GNAT family N-acetyltransferase [Protaetiibacter sp.]|nr:GNAT family N-acetyltransferase [Protaetiibacter sp.]
MSAPVIAPGDLADPRVLRLLEQHLADMHAASPPESVHALDVAGLRHPSVTFWVLREGDEVLGCVALKELDAGHGELKTMRTDAAARGRGLGRLLLAHVVSEARARGYARLSLETGVEDFFRPARALYRAAGFTPTGPFGGYRPDPNSVFLTLDLAADPSA